MGLNTNTLIYELIRGNEEQSELYNVSVAYILPAEMCFDDRLQVLLEDAGGVIGPTDLKAFTCAILISFPHYYPVSLNDEALTRTYGVGLSGTGIYTHIRCIRIWRQEVGNEGALAIVRSRTKLMIWELLPHSYRLHCYAVQRSPSHAWNYWIAILENKVVMRLQGLWEPLLAENYTH